MGKQIQTDKLTFFEHVKELRRRLTWSVLIFLVGAGAGYIYHLQIIAFLKHPLQSPLYYTSLAGNFNIVMGVSVLTGACVAVPVILYQLVRFVEPALSKRMKFRYLSLLTVLSGLLGLVGASFAYLVVIPMSLHFFQGFKIAGVSPLVSANNYLDFVIKCIVAFIIIFQLPLLILFINYAHPLSPKKLLKYEKFVIVGSLIIALVLPFTYDPITQFVIAVPIIFLYNLSLLLVWAVNRQARPVAQIVTRPPLFTTPAKFIDLPSPVVVPPVRTQPKVMRPRIISDVFAPYHSRPVTSPKM